MHFVSWTSVPAMLVAAVLVVGCSSSSHKSSSSTTSIAGAAGGANEVDRLLATGINQAQNKQFTQAQTTFQDVLTLDPGNYYAWYNLGLIAQTQDNSKAAVSDYQQALKIDPQDTSAMYNEAIVLEPTAAQEALSLYKQIVAINPKASTAYLRMSFLYNRLGDHADAATALHQATALDPALSSVPPPTT
jgi:Tfp pilus assembly protein PilF